MSTTLPDTTSTVNEIAVAREELGQTLFLIADRVAPKKVIARAKEKVRLAVTDKVEELKARVNPVEVVRRRLHGSPQVIAARSHELHASHSPPHPALSR